MSISFVDKLQKETDCFSELTLYSLDQIRATATQVVTIDDNHWLALSIAHPFDDENPSLTSCSMDFALFEFVHSEVDGKSTRVAPIFQGSGPTGSLREPRHIWWGEDGNGYTFYLPAKAVIKALEHLSVYYDWR